MLQALIEGLIRWKRGRVQFNRPGTLIESLFHAFDANGDASISSDQAL